MRILELLFHLAELKDGRGWGWGSREREGKEGGVATVWGIMELSGWGQASPCLWEVGMPLALGITCCLCGLPACTPSLPACVACTGHPASSVPSLALNAK